MKEGVSLMLLSLKQDDGVIGPGLRVMVKKAIDGCGFAAEAFHEGTNTDPGPDSEASFLEVFSRWREMTVISDEEQEKWLNKIREWVALRVKDIMYANRRNYYGECAAFVAALGEVMESRGKKGAKSALMEEYRVEYNRRRAFHDELRNYGMRW